MPGRPWRGGEGGVLAEGTCCIAQGVRDVDMPGLGEQRFRCAGRGAGEEVIRVEGVHRLTANRGAKAALEG